MSANNAENGSSEHILLLSSYLRSKGPERALHVDVCAAIPSENGLETTKGSNVPAATLPVEFRQQPSTDHQAKSPPGSAPSVIHAVMTTTIRSVAIGSKEPGSPLIDQPQ